MKDGEEIQVPAGGMDEYTKAMDLPDGYFVTDKAKLDHALAIGRSTLKTVAPNGFVARRDGDTVVMEGDLISTWSDTYNFDNDGRNPLQVPLVLLTSWAAPSLSTFTRRGSGI